MARFLLQVETVIDLTLPVQRHWDFSHIEAYGKSTRQASSSVRACVDTEYTPRIQRKMAF